MTTNARPQPQYGLKLAAHIISSDFGNLVAKVCECLLRRGCLTMVQISKFTELHQDKVKKCLWVLIQHNCVQGFNLEQEGPRDMEVTMYVVVFSNIIQRLRFAKFVALVSKEFDKESSEIVDGLLQHGRLTLLQVLDRAMDAPSKGSDASADLYRERFYKLVRNRFVERCPAAEPYISLQAQGEGGKKSHSSKFACKEALLEERVLAAVMPMDVERFSIPSEYDVNIEEEKSETNFPGAKVGEKRKQDLQESASEPELVGDGKEPVWRLNFDEFIHRLRIKACVEYTRAKHSNTEAVIVKSMLKGTKSTEDIVSLSVKSIYEEVIKSEEGCAMNLDRIRLSLQNLHFCSEVDDVYSINLRDIIEKAQHEEVESVVLKKYGLQACSVFRILSDSRSRLDTDKISDKLLSDKKETPQILYRLWQDNLIQMEKISTGNEMRDVILWSRKNGNVWHKFLDELYHAVLNLSLRCAHEKEREREIVNLTNFQKEKSTPELVAKRERSRKVLFLLQSSLLRLDDAIMLFHDFVI